MDAIGLAQGFQWVDGSFLEHVEDTEGRAPNDIDVVTYVYLPHGETQQTFMPRLLPLLDRTAVKERYKVDAFFRILPEVEIRDVCYWYSLWSHRRDGLWKGFAEVPLNLADDAQAQGELERILATDLAHDQ